MLRLTSVRVLGLGLLLYAASPAMAETAAELRQKIEETHAIYNAVSSDGLNPYSYDAVTVVPKGDGFRVSVTGVRMNVNPEDKATLDIGNVAFDMRPDEMLGGERLYRVSNVDLPKRWSYREDGEATAAVELGGIDFEGLWSFSLLSFLSGESTLDSLTFEASDGSGVATMKSLTGRWDSKDRGAGKFDIAGSLDSEGLRVSDDEGHFALAGMTGTFTAPNYDLGTVAEAWRKAAAAGGLENLSEEDLGNGVIGGLVPSSLNGDARLTLRGLSGSERESKQGFELQTLDLGYSVADAGSSFSKLSFSLAPLGLQMVGPDSQAGRFAAALLPADGAAVISLDRFPLETFLKMSQGFSGEDSSADSEAKSQELGLKVMDAMMAAGTSMDLTGTRIKTPDSEFIFKGGFVGDPAAHYRARGRIDIEAVGFDALVALVQAGMSDPDPEVQQQAAGANFILALLKGYAQRDASDPDRPVDRFLVELAPDGAVSVNGQPLLPPQTAR